MTKPRPLNANETKVLRFLAKQDSDFGVYPFAPLARRTGLTIREVRLSCRSLARKGLTEFHRGCWTDATRAGRDLIHSLPVSTNQANERA